MVEKNGHRADIGFAAITGSNSRGAVKKIGAGEPSMTARELGRKTECEPAPIAGNYLHRPALYGAPTPAQSAPVPCASSGMIRRIARNVRARQSIIGEPTRPIAGADYDCRASGARAVEAAGLRFQK
jgi:hypothetical protein